jgi:hypothetical protein
MLIAWHAEYFTSQVAALVNDAAQVPLNARKNNFVKMSFDQDRNTIYNSPHF